jgi:cytochrome P450
MMRRFNRGRERLAAAVDDLIAARRTRTASGKATSDDLLSMLLSAENANGGGQASVQVHDEVMTLLLAGHETTANALTWTWYLLSLHPEIERRVHAEVDALGGTPQFDDRARLAYTRRVVTEAMRLYPPAYAIGRRAVERFEVGGFTFPARTLVLASQFLQHRDQRWFADPARFDPDRWTPEEVAKRPRFSYFPFGAGTRACIGEQFAWTELVLVLATVARQWRFVLVPGQAVEPQARITLRPRAGLRMIAVRR